MEIHLYTETAGASADEVRQMERRLIQNNDLFDESVEYAGFAVAWMPERGEPKVIMTGCIIKDEQFGLCKKVSVLQRLTFRLRAERAAEKAKRKVLLREARQVVAEGGKFAVSSILKRDQKIFPADLSISDQTALSVALLNLIASVRKDKEMEQVLLSQPAYWWLAQHFAAS